MKFWRTLKLAREHKEIRVFVAKSCMFQLLFWILMPLTICMRILPFVVGILAEYTLSVCEWLSDHIPSPSGYFYYKSQDTIYAANRILEKNNVVLNKNTD